MTLNQNYAASPELALQGAVGEFLSQIAPIAARAGSQAFGQPALAEPVGQLAGHLTKLLPFEAGPQLAGPLQPQGGAIGGLLGQLAPGLGQVGGQL
nr:hypothetical protein [Actinomycetota bacterium]